MALDNTVYHQFKQPPPRSSVRNSDKETLRNRLTRIRRRANILFYVNPLDVASRVDYASSQEVDEVVKESVQAGAYTVALHRGVHRK